MTNKISTEELRYRVEATEKNHCQMWPANYWLDVQKELLAFREAAKNPVGLFVNRAGTWVELCAGDSFEHLYAVKLFAAPVLPKQPELVENLKKVMNNWLAMEPKLAFQPEFTDVMMLLDAEPAPAQPVIPEQQKNIVCYALIHTKTGDVYNTHSSVEHAEMYLKLMNQSDDSLAMRIVPLCVATTAQPVIPEQQTVQLAPHVYRELVNALRDVALEYHGAEQLRERISRTLSKTLTAAHPHLSQPVQEMTYMMATERGIKTSNREQWIKGYNAAINDGMLLSPAQPVSEPYKLKDAVEDIRNSGVEIDADKIKAERDAINSPVIPDGWKLVPIEPTSKMIVAAMGMLTAEELAEVWDDMIEAAPAQESE